MFHPQFQRAQFGHDGVDLHGNDLSRRKLGQRGQVDLEQAGLLQLTFSIRQDLPGLVAASDCRRKEPEFGGMSSEETEISSFDEQFRALLHPLRNDAQAFIGGLNPGTAGIELSRPM